MLTTARFQIEREKLLKVIFSQKNLTKIWREITRYQMRSLDVLDLHDYFDFNYNIEKNCHMIFQQLISGQYRAKAPTVYKVEKQFGICRHKMLPSPSDALILQTIAEYLATKLQKCQPTNNAFYIRERSSKLIFCPNAKKDYFWPAQWKKFQAKSLQLSTVSGLLVTTDVVNFYDNIGLRELRHVITNRLNAPEVILDLLFAIIEQLSWSPDYLPASLKGLPTISLEIFRMLGHILLFEVDEILNEKTGGKFVRWMDDINFGVQSKEDAHRILGAINDVLKSRGMALNLGKTCIYTSEEAKTHFLVEENKYLDRVISLIDKDVDARIIEDDLIEKFNCHKDKRDLRSWSKVTKRFFTAGGKLKSEILIPEIPKLFAEQPEIRSNIIYYLRKLGFTSGTSSIIIKIMKEVTAYDDVTLFSLVKLLTDWDIPTEKYGRRFIREIFSIISSPQSDFDYFCLLWFSGKYSEPKDLLTIITTNREIWNHNLFLRRQVVSILPRIIVFEKEAVLRFLDRQFLYEPQGSASVAVNIRSLLQKDGISSRMRFYLFPTCKQNPYPLPKFLVLSAVLVSEKNSRNLDVRKMVNQTITDSWYRHWLEKFYSKISTGRITDAKKKPSWGRTTYLVGDKTQEGWQNPFF